MAYQTGSVQNTFELYDKLQEWLTGSAGWTIQTSASSAGTGSTDYRDSVFWSSGSDGNKSLTVRSSFLNPENNRSGSTNGRLSGLTSSLALSKSPQHVENVYDYVNFTGYLNWGLGSGSGTSSYGIMGPSLHNIPRQNVARAMPNPIQVWNYTSSVSNAYSRLVNDKTFTRWSKGGLGMTGSDNFKHGWDDVPGWGYAGAQNWDGRRRFHYTMRYYQNPNTVNTFNDDDTTLAAYDMSNGNAQGFGWQTDKATKYSGYQDYSLVSSILVHDSGSQHDIMYYATEDGTSEWHSWNLNTNVHTYLTDFPDALSANQGQLTVFWDGDDCIYSTSWEGDVSWFKYSISGDSWTTLTNTPTNGNEYHTPVVSCGYIPSSYSGITLTNSAGNPTDVVFYAADDGASVFSRYNVSGDEWNAQSSAITLPDSATWQLRYDKGWFDSEYLWFFDNSTYTTWKINISASTYADGSQTWTKHQDQINSSVAFISGATNRQLVPINNTHVSKVRGRPQAWYLEQATTMNYWFQGDQDSVNIITEPASGRYFWSHFGTYDTLVATNTMKSTAAFASGSIVTVPVESTTGFVVGQEVLFADVSGSATVEKNQILEIVNSTSFKVTNLENNFNSGTLIGTDPHQAVVTGDSFMAGTSLDGGGYQSDSIGSTYRVIPSVNTQLMRLTNKNAQGFYTPWPLMMYNNVRELNTFQAKGMLKGCWVIKDDPGTYPSLVSGDSLNIAGTTYKVFPLEETTTMMPNEIDRFLLLIKTE